MVILVDEKDTCVGTMEKIEAHRKAYLHRAFSVFIFNSKNELLLQQRAFNKYHSPGLWTNTCCSHPLPGEDVFDGANRRLREEMWLRVKLNFLFKFMYKAPFDNGLTEYEIDYVYIGKTDAIPQINPEEAAGYRYISLEDLQYDMWINPEKYTSWFRIIMEKHFTEISCALGS